MSRKHISAGETFAELVRKNPDSAKTAAVKRYQARAEAWRKFLASPPGESLFRRVAEFKNTMTAEAAEWEELTGTPFPTDPDEITEMVALTWPVLKDLTRRSHGEIRREEYTLRDVYHIMKGVLRKMKHERDVANATKVRDKCDDNENRNETPSQTDTRYSKPDGRTRWAKKYGVHRTTLNRWIKNGKIRVIEMSDRSLRIHKKDVP